MGDRRKSETLHGSWTAIYPANLTFHVRKGSPLDHIPSLGKIEFKGVSGLDTEALDEWMAISNDLATQARDRLAAQIEAWCVRASEKMIMAKTTIERLARALTPHCLDELGYALDGDDWPSQVEGVRAVLTAMRQPTDTMVFAGMDKLPVNPDDDGNDQDKAIAVWQAMIDEILAEQPR